MPIVLLAFIVMPIIEMLILIKVGSQIGALYTIMLVLLTALIGVALLKRQGLRTLMQANQKMRSGQMPVSEMGEGLILAVAGALLLTPGFVTDTIGFLLLTPGVRQLLIGAVVKALSRSMVVASETQRFEYGYSEVHRDRRSEADDPSIIDGEFTEVDKDDTFNEKK